MSIPIDGVPVRYFCLANNTDLKLAYILEGHGPELLIFLHSVGGNLYTFAPQIERIINDPVLSERYTCLSMDMRGHGLSALSKEAHHRFANHAKIETFAQDSIALMEHAGFARAHLIGLSMGGTVAQEIYKQAPQRVMSLALANTWCHVDDREQRVAFIHDVLKDKSMKESAEMLVPGLFTTAPKQYVAAGVATEGAKDKDVFLANWSDMFALDYRSMWPRVSVPTLLIGGQKDTITPTDPLLTTIKSLNMQCRLIDIPGAGHYSNLDDVDTFNRHLLEHLRRSRPHSTGAIRLHQPLPRKRSFAADIVAHGLMRLLNERKIDYFFSNSGTDFTPIIDALARYHSDPSFKLKTLVAPHENTAIGMAHGYYLMTGRPQAVMAHVNVGTANMGLGIINANRSRIPMLVLSGKTPWYESGIDGCRTNFVQWGQDTFDQGAYFREFTKWDYELKSEHSLEIVIDRALAISQSDPQGPVYLTLPKEPLCKEIDDLHISDRPRQVATVSSASLSDLQAAAREISAAQHPLIITAEIGRYVCGPESLAAFADSLGIGVIEHGKRNFYNFPTEHPLHQGFDPTDAIKHCDLLIVVEAHVPFIPAFANLDEMPKTIAIGVDPLCQSIPMRGFAADIVVPGMPADTLERLTELCHVPAERVSERKSELAKAHSQIFKSARADAASDANRATISKRFLSWSLGQVIDQQTIIFNEYDLDPLLVPRSASGSWYENSVASGLGWSLGAACGAALATDDTIVVTLGDGSYMFNTPLSAHYVAGANRLGIVIVVFNDTAWTTIKKSYLGTNPDGWGRKTGHMPLCDFDMSVSFEYLAQACGGVGLRVEEPSKLNATLKQALEIARDKDNPRHVLVNVICDRD